MKVTHLFNKKYADLMFYPFHEKSMSMTKAAFVGTELLTAERPGNSEVGSLKCS